MIRINAITKFNFEKTKIKKSEKLKIKKGCKWNIK